MLRGRILSLPLQHAARPVLAQQLAFRPVRWHTTALPASAEETSIPLGKDRGHIATAKGESLAFFDRAYTPRFTRDTSGLKLTDLRYLPTQAHLSPLSPLAGRDEAGVSV